jgi:hypothetical protein
VLNINAARYGSVEIAEQLLERRRRLKWIPLQYLKQPFCLGPKVTGRQLLGVLPDLFGVIELPGHQLSSVLDLLNGSRNPFRIDSRIPGIDRRKSVSWMLLQSPSETKTALLRLPVIWTGSWDTAESSTS